MVIKFAYSVVVFLFSVRARGIACLTPCFSSRDEGIAGILREIVTPQAGPSSRPNQPRLIKTPGVTRGLCRWYLVLVLLSIDPDYYSDSCQCLIIVFHREVHLYKFQAPIMCVLYAWNVHVNRYLMMAVFGHIDILPAEFLK